MSIFHFIGLNLAISSKQLFPHHMIYLAGPLFVVNPMCTSEIFYISRCRSASILCHSFIHSFYKTGTIKTFCFCGSCVCFL